MMGRLCVECQGLGSLLAVDRLEASLGGDIRVIAYVSVESTKISGT